MTLSEWKVVMDELLDGVEGELHSSASVKSKLALNEFRRLLNEGRTGRRRKHFEQQLEAFLQSRPFLRAATKRYVRRKLEAAIAELERVGQVLAKVITMRRAAQRQAGGHKRKTKSRAGADFAL